VGTTQPTGYAPSTNRTFGANIVPVQETPGTVCPTGSVCAFNPSANNYLDTATGYYMTKRDAFYGHGIYRFDTRLQERHQFGDRYAGTIAVEAFNLFNHANYGNYNVTITNSNFGTPAPTTSAATGVPVEFRPRSLQFLARFEF
jgi:hypothetical protein